MTSDNANDVKDMVDDLEFDSYPFSKEAFKYLKTQISQNIKELVDESIKIAKRHHSDTVSISHVDRASDNLGFSAKRKILIHLGTIGGILLGAALSAFVSMWMVGQYAERGVIFSVIAGIIGAVLITVQMSKDS